LRAIRGKNWGAKKDLTRRANHRHNAIVGRIQKSPRIEKSAAGFFIPLPLAAIRFGFGLAAC
jgi:hypothetical protein